MTFHKGKKLSWESLVFKGLWRVWHHLVDGHVKKIFTTRRRANSNRAKKYHCLIRHGMLVGF